MKRIKSEALVFLVVILLSLAFAGCAETNETSVPDNDFHTALQYSYINARSVEDIGLYAVGKDELSRPRAITLDFGAYGVSSDSYVLEYSYDADFSDSVILSGLKEKKASVYNLFKGKTVYYRGATSLEQLASSPVQTITISDKGPRNLFIDGVSNVRDVGGYSSYLVSGGKLRQGLYYRGANADSITDEGKSEFLRLGVKQEIDLRDEKYCKGSFSPDVSYNAVSIPSGTESTRFEEFADEYKKIFTLIADASSRPVYLHCTAGADRTGICTFMLLTVCGVGYEDIARDYLFTNFSFYGSRLSNFHSEFEKWWKKLDAFDGKNKADKAKSWLVSKGLTEKEVEKIRETFVEGYESVSLGV